MSEIHELCRKTYQEYVRDCPTIPGDLKRALKAHERVPAFIDNVAREIRKLKFRVKRETIESAVRDLTNFFVLAVKREAEQRVRSPLDLAMERERRRRMEAFRREADALEQGGLSVVTKDAKGETDRQEVVFDFDG
jgi:hypothetical protein